ncbi:DEAD/DEAH box helicase [Nocardia xishanensis]
MDAFGVLDKILGDYQDFVSGFLNIKDPTVRQKVETEVANGLLWPEPWLALNPAFEPGGTVTDLFNRGVLHPAAREIFRVRSEEDQFGREISFHRHQSDAFEVAQRGESYVLTTGTGSGKSMSYIVPIVDRVLREGSGRGVRAIVVYPMNALANSQLGELEKFLGKDKPKVTFARYTGQESRDERDAILQNPPDILLTNYVMLELMLTRPRERSGLITSAADLAFLVLDELHTYRGRQGADVAMLIRRLRGAVGARSLQCIGTSATLAGPGTKAEQRQQVADLATRIFGTDILPGSVIGETLRRATSGVADPAALAARLQASTPSTWEELHCDPLAIWTEQQFGLREDDEGQLARQVPARLRSAAQSLAKQTGIEPQVCEEKLRELLLAGSRVRDNLGRPLFAFKLHQFIGKGDTAYATLDRPDVRYLTTQYQRSSPVGTKGQPLFPLAFCRECGQDFLVVNLDKGGQNFSPRILNGGRGDQAEATGLLLITEQSWPSPADPALVDLVPEDWVIEVGGSRVLDKGRRTRLPEPYHVDQFGTVTDEGLTVAFFETLHFCPSCKTSYESSQQSEFSRVASLGTEGRASAVTVLSQAVVRTLRTGTDLDAEARKFLVFSDNRQDASLQAGHFNDFVLVGLVRSALYRAALDQQEKDPDEPLGDENLGSRVVSALGGDLADFAKDPDTAHERIPRTKITRALRDVVTYRLWADLKRGWRITMPNLEQTGQLRLTYFGIEDVAEDDSKWADCGQPLAGAEPETRQQIMGVLLDELRRYLCIESEFLTEEKYDSIKRASQDWLKAPWALSDEQGVYSGTAYPGSRPKFESGSRADHYLSGLSAYGRWLRRPDRFPLHAHPLKPTDADSLIESLLKVMAKAGILVRIEERNRRVGYRIQAGLIEWRAGTGEFRAADPIRGNQTTGRVNPFFRHFYAETAARLVGLEAREHTAQVEPSKRLEREKSFGAATLPVLYCSPTMELGVDIKSLNVVGMRNVPPTPANYAQRSGRAGRSGQPAVVFTYCATGNAHDAYYFGRGQDMVAGAVAPPRLELGNQDLVRAHAHSIWIVMCDLDLKGSMIELLDIEEPGQPLQSAVRAAIESSTNRARAVQAITRVLEATEEVTSAPWWTDRWVIDTVDNAARRFDQAADRWRSLYREALTELDAANDILKTIGASEAAKRQARGRISEARAALDLLRGQVDDINQGDFYPYRYFASEGFLPGYSFPRLPLAAFIPAERRTKNGQGDYVQRPRFLAISEFGPGAFIYHEGARYEVNRVSLPAREDGTGVNITEIKRCNICGYLHESNGPTSVEFCDHCGAGSLETLDRMMRLISVKTRRRDRISADEDERQRAGHEIVTTLRFVPHGERAGQQTSTVMVDGSAVGSITYGDTALIRRMNVGLRRRKDKDVKGHLLDTLEGRWAREADLDMNTHGDPVPRIRRVVPYVEDHRNALLLHLDPSIPNEVRMAAMYALKRAIEAVFQLESNELAVEPLPGGTGDHAWSRLLFFEAAEGGAGVLRQLATEDGHIRAVARKALEILHFDPDSGDDLRRAEHAVEDCAQACYDCLLSYSNQWDHQHLDRHCVADLLKDLMRATIHVGAGGEDRAAQLRRLREESNGLEQRFLELLEVYGFRLPDAAQRLVDGYYVRPDFAFHTPGADIAVFIDGPVHDSPRQVEKDDQARVKLMDEAGWIVLRFNYADTDVDWLETIKNNPEVFGRGRVPA